MKVRKFCKFCREEYFISPYRVLSSVYCSRSCRSKDKRGEDSVGWKGGKSKLFCKHCGGEFYRHPSQKGDYCSPSCRSSATRARGEKSNFWKGGKAKYLCAFCGNEFVDASGRNRQYCSVNCHDEARKKRIQITCTNCGSIYSESQSRANRYKNSFCSITCRNAYKIGERASNWMGGKSFEPYPPTFNEPFKRKIRERDGYKCAICGMEGKDVHHIDYNKENTTEENCITLCRKCHARTNGNREYWKQYFSNH